MRVKNRKVELSADINLPVDKLWRIVTDVEGYPTYIRYMYKAGVAGQFKVGSYWSDLSTVMFFPLIVRHKIMMIRRGKEIAFLIKLPFGGQIIQNIVIKKVGERSNARIVVTINLGSFILDFLVGSLLEWRTTVMFESTLARVQESSGQMPHAVEETSLFEYNYQIR